MSLKAAVAALLLVAVAAPRPAHADAYRAKPKLVIELVIDQFRGDYVERYRDDFKTPMGFNLFLKRGANFTDCYYDYANTMTAPGHSTIGTGAYSDGHGIALNDWWDFSRSTEHTFSSVQDERYQLIGPQGVIAGQPGVSPRNELASTLADEVVLATGGRSRAFGISLKDRAAILTSGHATGGAYFLDHATGAFVTSSYWVPQLPAWVQAFDNSPRAAQARKEANAPTGDFYELVGKSPASVSYLLDFGKSLIAAEQLGKHDTTDVLTISISSTDILGHIVGPDAPEQRAMIDAIDSQLNDFFNWVNTHVDGGMANVWVSLTGDHGIGPTIEQGTRVGMPSAVFPTARIYTFLDQKLNDKFSPGRKEKYVLGGEIPYIALDQRTFERYKIAEKEGEETVAALLPAAFDSLATPDPASPSDHRLTQNPILRQVYTKLQMAHGELPPTDYGRTIAHSYSPNNGWWIFFTPGMNELTSNKGTNHYTPYSYDRHVPLAFYGSAFKPGTYHDRVAPVDIAATFASLLRINQPSASIGRVLTEALKPEAEPATSAATKPGKP